MNAPFLERLARRERCLLGTWVKLDALETLELLAMAGFDYVVIDMEHAPHTFQSMYRSTVVAQGLGLSALVRLADASGVDAQRVLDSGVDGVLLPRVRSPAEAKTAAAALRFAPAGERGLGITSRAGRWGLDSTANYVARGERDVFRAAQLEDPEAIAAADGILDAPGINALFVGQGDLALMTGRPGTDTANQRLVQQVVEVAKRRGVPCGTAVGDAAAAKAAADRGFDYVMVSNDLTLFGKAAAELVRAARA